MKRFVSFAALLALGVSLVFAAGGGQQGGGQAPASTGAPLGARGTGKEYWMVKYPEPITLHVVSSEIATLSFPRGDDMGNNAWIRAIKKHLNIDVVTDWVAPSADFTTRVNLAIASNDLPDVFFTNPSQFRQVTDAKLVADLTDYTENNLSEKLKKAVFSDQSIIDSAKVNGRLYGIPKYGDGPLPMPNAFWIRKDWFEASGLPIPRTFTDVEKIMDAFMKAHPGTYGTLLGSSLDEFSRAALGFGAHPFDWIKDKSGNIVFGGTQPETKEALALFAGWYKKGYLRQDFMSMNGDAVRQDIAAGKAGVDFHQQWWGWYVGADMIRNYGLNAYFENYEYPSKDGSLVNHRKYYDNSGFFVVNKNYKYPDAVLKLMSYYLYIEAWAVGDGFITQAELDDINLQAGGGNGRGLHIPETWARLVAPIEGSTPQDDYAAVQWAKTHNEDLSKFNSQAAIDAYYQGRSFAKEGNPEGMGEFLQKYHDRGAYAVNINILRDNRWVDIYPKGFTPDEVVAYGSTLTDILKEGFTQIIVGQQPLSYFETLVQEWKASGGDIATQAMNREYKGK